MPTRLVTAGVLAGGSRIVDLSRPMQLGMPQSPNHPEFRLSMPRRHGDTVRADGGSAANDLLVSGTHVGTHIDALGHVSHCGELHGGVDAEAAQRAGRLGEHGVEQIRPIVARGVLLASRGLHGVDSLAGGTRSRPTIWSGRGSCGRGDRPRRRRAGPLGLGSHWDDAECLRRQGVRRARRR